MKGQYSCSLKTEYNLQILEELYIKNCGITDISEVFSQENLDSYEDGKIIDIFDLSENNLLNFNVLSGFQKIRELNL